MKPVLSAITQCIYSPKGASQSQTPFFDIKKSKDTYEGISCKADCMQLPLTKVINTSYTLEGRQENQ